MKEVLEVWLKAKLKDDLELITLKINPVAACAVVNV